MNWLSDLFSNPWTYAVLAGIALTPAAYSAWRKTPLLQVVQKNVLLMVGAVGFLALGGLNLIADNFAGTASLDTAVTGEITTFQFTTAPTSSCTTDTTSERDVLGISCLDAATQDTNTEVNGTIITVTRDGKLPAASYPVVISCPDYKSMTAPGDGVDYNILEKNGLNEVAFYAASGAAATTASPRASASGAVTSLAFAEGDADQTLGILINIDEEGLDALTTYGHKTCGLWVGNKGMTIDIQALD